MKHLLTWFLFFQFVGITITFGQGVDLVNSPYQSVYTHLYNLQPDTYNPRIAARTISPQSYSDTTQAVRIALRLKQVLDGRGLFVKMANIPKEINYYDSAINKHVFTIFPEELPEIYLEKEGDNWFYSPESINQIKRLHKEIYPYGADVLVNLFPKLANKALFGFFIWQYLGVLFLLLIAFILNKVINLILRPIIRALYLRWTKDAQNTQIKKIRNIISVGSLLITIQIVKALLPIIQFPAMYNEFFLKLLSVVQVALFVYLLLKILEIGISYFKTLTDRTESKMDDQIVPLLHTILWILIVLGGIVQALLVIQVNVAPLIAGLSIGGLALALAAQDAVKNFIGSLMIIFDKPFQIGDYVIGSSFEGTVEEVGFRTTRIRTIDTSVISVPNGEMSNTSVKNLGVRFFRLFNTELTVTYDSSPVRLEQFIEGLKEIIIREPLLRSDNYYVFLKELSDSSLNIMFRAYMEVPGYMEELALKEKIIFKIIHLADFLGIEFAFPSRSLYIEQMTRADKEADSSSGKNDRLNLKEFFGEEDKS